MTTIERWIPTETLQAIFEQLPPADRQSLSTLVQCTALNKRIRSVIALPKIWEPHYRSNWRRSNPDNEANRIERMGGDWHALTIERGKLDYKASVLLETMLTTTSSSKEFMKLARQIVNDLGLDVSDYLHSRIRPFSSRDRSDSQWLSRSYWAKEMIGVMGRRVAIDSFSNMPDSMPLEQTMSILSAFWCVDYESIRGELDELAYQCRTHLRDSGIHLPGSEGFQLEETCWGIHSFMCFRGFGRADLEGISNRANSFIHLALTTTRQTSPLILVIIFIAITQRFGLEVSLIRLFRNFYARVCHPTDGPSIAVDVGGDPSQLLLSDQDLVARLEAAGIGAERASKYLAPASNWGTLQSVLGDLSYPLFGPRQFRQFDQQRVVSEWEWAHTSHALAALAILTHPHAHDVRTMRLTSDLNELYSSLPLDNELVVQSCIIPKLQALAGNRQIIGALRQPLATAASQLDKETRKLRGGNPSPTVFIGLLMYHRIERWVGIVCDRRRKEPAIESAEVQREDAHELLLRVYYSDRSPSVLIQGPQKIHRAAEGELDAVRWSRPSTSGAGSESDQKWQLPDHVKEAWGDLDVLLEVMPDVGRKFRDVKIDYEGRVWFVPGPELEAAYPEDVLLGKAMMGLSDSLQN